MQTKTVKCPSCGVVLEVRNSKDEEVKIINCPQCKTALRVKFGSPVNEPLDAETRLAGGNRGSETVLGGRTPVQAKVFIVCGEKKYELSEGRHVVGRKASTSSADVQIETDDRFMSRHNAVIKVSRTGDSLMVTIGNDRNQNPIKVGNVELLQGDEVVLSDGDTLIMGKTRMTLIIVQS